MHAPRAWQGTPGNVQEVAPFCREHRALPSPEAEVCGQQELCRNLQRLPSEVASIHVCPAIKFNNLSGERGIIRVKLLSGSHQDKGTYQAS